MTEENNCIHDRMSLGMNRRAAQIIVDLGITYQALRDLMFGEFDGARSKMIPELTRSEAYSHLRACVDRKDGFVHPKSADAITAILILMEFGSDL